MSVKLVVVPDSFKGTLSSIRICGIIRESAERIFPGCEVVTLPVADGGEGSVDAFLSASRSASGTGKAGQKVIAKVTGPLFDFGKVRAGYALIDGGRTAVIEMAACAGLPLIGDRKDPLRATTFGVGELMLDAVKKGAKRILLCLGGSATNDGGCGAAAACGARFYDREGKTFLPTGGTLAQIERIDLSGIRSALDGVSVTAMCDIDNPMYGEKGAARVFAPQKGADEQTVGLLDAGLVHFAGVLEKTLGKDYSSLPGSGAAGAFGGGAAAFFGASLVPGIEALLDTVRFEEAAADADLVITGEGRLDAQSIRGKVISGVAKRTSKLGRPLIAVVGGAEDREIGEIYSLGVSAVFTVNRLPQDLSVSAAFSEDNLRNTADNIFRLILALTPKK